MPQAPPKPGRVKAFYVTQDYKAENNEEMTLQEGEMIFVKESAVGDGFMNVACGDRQGKLSSRYVTDGLNRVATIEYPLHEAAKRGNFDLVGDCLKHGISVNSLDTSGSTPLYWAAFNGHTNIVEQLLQQPNIADFAQNKLGDSPMHGASRKGHLACVRALVEHGASVHLANKAGLRPVQLAKDVELAAFLKLIASKVPEPAKINEYASSEEEAD